MALLRILAVFFISFLLLSPLFKSITKQIEKPIIIFAQDNSESVVINKKSEFKKQYKSKINSIINSFSEEYTIKTYTFGEKIRKNQKFEFNEKYTDFSSLFKEINNKYFNRNVGALIIASDGIYNKGTNPIYVASDINFPLYTIAMGNADAMRDVILSKVMTNKIAFLGNKFPIRAYVEMKEYKAAKTLLKVYHYKNGLGSSKTLVFSKEINAKNNDYSEIVDIELEAKQIGIQFYKIELQGLESELNLKNNTKDIIIDVVDSKQKILILANSPHPDITAIKSALEINKNYHVDFYMIKKFKENIEKYNLVILHQIPSLTNSASSFLSKLSKNEIPLLFVTGSQTSYYMLNNLILDLNIQHRRKTFDNAMPLLNENFDLFELDNNTKKFIRNAPPLLTPFGNYTFSAGSKVLLNQRIRSVKTNKPMILFNNATSTNKKIGFIVGEGLWRWKIDSYVQTKSHDVYNELINKIIQYLSIKINKDRFIVKSKRIISENETLEFKAELYNKSYELINKPNIEIIIKNSDNKSFKYSFTKTNKSYYLNAGNFPIGNYSYSSRVKIDGKVKVKSGKFAIVPVNVESENTIANHKLLYRLANENNGKMFTADQLDSLVLMINDNNNIVSIMHTEKKLENIINYKWLFFLILLLISSEWFFRKFNGTY